MAKKFIKKFMPDPAKIRDSKYLKIFGRLLHSPNLWHLNRRSVSGAFAIGLFCAFIPLPFQMVFAAAFAISFRTNLPISVALVWLTNPITMPPMIIGAYLFGAWIMNISVSDISTKIDTYPTFWDGLTAIFPEIWQPFLLGCSILGVVCAIVGYFTIRILWRWHIVKEWEIRKQKRLNKA